MSQNYHNTILRAAEGATCTHHAPPAAHLLSLLGLTSMTDTRTVTVPMLLLPPEGNHAHRGRKEKGRWVGLGSISRQRTGFSSFTWVSCEGLPFSKHSSIIYRQSIVYSIIYQRIHTEFPFAMGSEDRRAAGKAKVHLLNHASEFTRSTSDNVLGT